MLLLKFDHGNLSLLCHRNSNNALKRPTDSTTSTTSGKIDTTSGQRVTTCGQTNGQTSITTR